MPTTIASTNISATVTTRVFQNGNSQALRIPQDLRTDKKEFFIRRIGDIYIAYPTDDPWASARQAIGSFSGDFMSDRNQPSWNEVTKRPSLDDNVTTVATFTSSVAAQEDI